MFTNVITELLFNETSFVSMILYYFSHISDISRIYPDIYEEQSTQENLLKKAR